MTATLVLAALLAPKVDLLARLDDPRISESSGLAASPSRPGVWYTHNDSGDRARFFRFGEDGRVTGTFQLTDARAIDWEDMAAARIAGKPRLYLADIGDNASRRAEIQVYSVAEPEGVGRSLGSVQTFRIRYPDGAHDCEAFFVQPGTGAFWLITKARQGVPAAYVVRRPRAGTLQTAEKVADLSLPVPAGMFGLITAADVSPDGRKVAIRTYGRVLLFQVRGRFEDWVRTEPVVLPSPAEFQGEAIGFSRDGQRLLTTSEGTPCPVSVIAPLP